MTVTQMKKWIDGAPYEALLSHWRFAAVGDPYCTGEVGKYFKDALEKKRCAVGNEQHIRTSKSIGWEARRAS
jgi:hypothetical protein